MSVKKRILIQKVADEGISVNVALNKVDDNRIICIGRVRVLSWFDKEEGTFEVDDVTIKLNTHTEDVKNLMLDEPKLYEQVLEILNQEKEKILKRFVGISQKKYEEWIEKEEYDNWI